MQLTVGRAGVPAPRLDLGLRCMAQGVTFFTSLGVQGLEC